MFDAVDQSLYVTKIKTKTLSLHSLHNLQKSDHGSSAGGSVTTCILDIEETMGMSLTRGQRSFPPSK